MSFMIVGLSRLKCKNQILGHKLENIIKGLNKKIKQHYIKYNKIMSPQIKYLACVETLNSLGQVAWFSVTN